MQKGSNMLNFLSCRHYIFNIKRMAIVTHAGVPIQSKKCNTLQLCFVNILCGWHEGSSFLYCCSNKCSQQLSNTFLYKCVNSLLKDILLVNIQLIFYQSFQLFIFPHESIWWILNKFDIVTKLIPKSTFKSKLAYTTPLNIPT